MLQFAIDDSQNLLISLLAIFAMSFFQNKVHFLVLLPVAVLLLRTRVRPVRAVEPRRPAAADDEALRHENACWLRGIATPSFTASLLQCESGRAQLAKVAGASKTSKAAAHVAHMAHRAAENAKLHREERKRALAGASFAGRVRAGGRDADAIKAYRRAALVDLFLMMDEDG